ncbi:MAG: phosphatidate cytidylyltransferase [Xanthomonadaceae bacterium]|nr:phosphatidate cytidylyltransferase [Xanthomonadaceae bacterium]MDP2184099.1 phosphatidate cytidylyltransferase [Xanthomonadales bacterium]MDZ4115180.1 phosphatidate cytidylyltransferase [Xanthomonadaceae bacterium]MDZ4377026.1 phosphatidate cytidylyltransferase [Xanthomonadaceae bacterium]
MRQRILTALLLLPAAIACVLWLPTPWLGSLASIIILLGLWELTHLIGLQTLTTRLAYLAANVAVMCWLVWSVWLGLALGMVVIGAAFWLLVPLWLANPGAFAGHSRQHVAIKLLAGSLAAIPAWSALLLLHGDGALGPRWALLALASVWAADSFAFFSGSRWGRRKLAPKISPGKTWAGLWGGLAGCVLITLIAAPALGLGWLEIPALALLALVTGVFSVFGDLLESVFKRQAGSKDSGALIPGHGGVLDRIDSLLAALPVFVVFKLLLGL